MTGRRERSRRHRGGAVAAGTALTPALVVRTVLLDSVAGVVYGWLFWARSLETAMVAHGFGHILFTAAAWIGLA